MAVVEPTKSASASTSGGHSGCATSMAPNCSRACLACAAVNLACTSQRPCHRISSTAVWPATWRPRNSSGRKITFGVPIASTTCTALAELQMASDSAFTAAEVFA